MQSLFGLFWVIVVDDGQFRVMYFAGQCVGGCSIAMCSVKGVPTGGVLSFCRVMVLTERLRLSVFCCLSCCRLKGSEVEALPSKRMTEPYIILKVVHIQH